MCFLLPSLTSSALSLNTTEYSSKITVTYKSTERKKLEEKGYRIIGNIGDLWNDILETNTSNRTFKFPDPMYHLIDEKTSCKGVLNMEIRGCFVCHGFVQKRSQVTLSKSL
ncbi:hypothetical protein VNO77_08608 [Canavalia gladiata]|uniref:Uncharacterized protein n=1 Tax=Canavalia gladiata TaxID=3824 RepID=A0AAN9M8M8_CANGL